MSNRKNRRALEAYRNSRKVQKTPEARAVARIEAAKEACGRYIGMVELATKVCQLSSQIAVVEGEFDPQEGDPNAIRLGLITEGEERLEEARELAIAAHLEFYDALAALDEAPSLVSLAPANALPR